MLTFNIFIWNCRQSKFTLVQLIIFIDTLDPHKGYAKENVLLHFTLTFGMRFQTEPNHPNKHFILNGSLPYFTSILTVKLSIRSLNIPLRAQTASRVRMTNKRKEIHIIRIQFKDKSLKVPFAQAIIILIKIRQYMQPGVVVFTSS